MSEVRGLPPKGQPPIPKPRPSRTAPNPFSLTDIRLRDAADASTKRRLAPWMTDPFSRVIDTKHLIHAPELRETFDTNKRLFGFTIYAQWGLEHMLNMVEGRAQPRNSREVLYKAVFSRRPEVIKKAVADAKQVAGYGTRRGPVNPATLSKLTAGPFERAIEYIQGEFEESQAVRDTMFVELSKDWAATQTQLHELRHISMQQPKYKKYLREAGILEEELVRAMDWYYAPDVFKQGALTAMAKGGDHAYFHSYTADELGAMFELKMVRHIKAMEKLD